MTRFWKILRVIAIIFPLLVVILLVVGYFMPFTDREGRCTICGLKFIEKSSPWLSEPVVIRRQSRLSRFYGRAELPDHDHLWEYMGGTSETNLYGYPAKFEFERSDPLLLVSDEYMVDVLRRLENSENRIELLRVLNCIDDYFREMSREQLYAFNPGRAGQFIGWWEVFKSEIDAPIICPELPGVADDSSVQEENNVNSN